MVVPVTMAVRAATWASKKAANTVADKYGDRINEKLGDRWGGVAEKVGSRLGVQLPRRSGESETTPYLGKWDRISQVWLNRWTILLMLVLARVLISTSSVDDSMEDAKEKVLSLCVSLEDTASTMASMPHYMSSGINEMTAAGIEGTIHGVVFVTTLLISGVEQLIIFVIGMWKSTWMCLISALIQGAFDLAAQVVEGAADLAKAATSGIADVLQGAEDAFSGFTNAINKIPLIPDIPDLKLDSAIDTLKNLNINVSDAIGDIMDVKDKVPTYQELENKTAEIISIPFNLIKGEINDAWGNYQFDRNILPVAAKDQVLICSNDERIPGFFADLANTLNTIRGIFIAIIVLAAVAMIVFYCWQEIRQWNRAEQTIDMANEKAHDLFDAAWIAENPYLARFAFYISERMSSDPDKQLLIRWTIAYGTSPRALFVLSLAVSGLLTCLFQLIMLNILKSELPKLAAGISGVAAGVVSALDSTSANWANDTNTALDSFSADINEDMFGKIKTATSAVNDALTVFTDGINEGLETAFGNTPFMDPLKTVVDCVLLDKVEKVQAGLTWVEENAQLSFPVLANDTFSLKKLASNGSDTQAFLNDPEAATNAEVSSSVSKITDKLKASVIQEMLISMVLLLVYIIVVLMGVGRAIYGANAGINASKPGGGQYGANGAAPDAMDVPPVDVDENGQHWVEHDGVQYMIDPSGQYVIGEDGGYITRKPRGDDDSDSDSDGSDSDGESDDEDGRRNTRGGNAANNATAGGWPRDEKAADDDGWPRDEKTGFHDQDEDPFDDRYNSQPPDYPSSSYQPPYVEGGKF